MSTVKTYNVDTGDLTNLSVKVNGTTRVVVGNAGQLGIGGENYGTSGQVLTSQGPSAAPTWITPSGFSNLVVFATAGANTWTVPTEVTRAKVTVVGGGGSGAAGSTAIGGGGGGGGGAAIRLYTDIVPNTTYTLTVGAASGASSFAGPTTISATAGSSATQSGGAGGLGSGGQLNIGGGSGGTGGGVGGSTVNFGHVGASGGSSIFGGGGRGGQVGAAGTVGSAFGGGGGGGGSSGAAGASGVVIIEY